MKQGDFTGWVNSSRQRDSALRSGHNRYRSGYWPVTRMPLNCNGAVNVICPDRIDPICQFLTSLLPDPTLPGLFNNIPVVGSCGETQRVFSVKGDWNSSPKSHFAGLYGRELLLQSSPPIGPIPSPLGNNFSTSGKSDFSAFPTTTRLLRPAEPLCVERQLDAVPGVFIVSRPRRGRRYAMTKAQKSTMALKGIPGDPNAAPLYVLNDGYAELNFWTGTNSPDRTWMLQDTINKISGRHSMKFGFEYLHTLFARKDCNQCAGEVDFSDAITGLPGATFQTGSSVADSSLDCPIMGRTTWAAWQRDLPITPGFSRMI